MLCVVARYVRLSLFVAGCSLCCCCVDIWCVQFGVSLLTVVVDCLLMWFVWICCCLLCVVVVRCLLFVVGCWLLFVRCC